VVTPAHDRPLGHRRPAGGPLILAALRTHGRLTQVELADRTGLTPAAVSVLVRELAGQGRVDIARTTRTGRSANAITLSRRSGVVVGIDIGHSHIAVASSDLAHQILDERSAEFSTGGSRDGTVELAVQLVLDSLAAGGATPDELLGIGLGIPGPLWEKDREVTAGTILPDWVGTHPAELFEHAFPGVPVTADNDSNLGALGERYWGAGLDAGDLIYIKLSTGVGAGLILNGAIHRGSGGTAGEIGHLQVDPDGLLCACGNRGCLETVLGLPYLLRALTRPDEEQPTLAEVAARAADDDPFTLAALRYAGNALGTVLAGLSTTLSPSLVVVGGRCLELGDHLTDIVLERARSLVLPALSDSIHLKPGMLGNRAELLGALTVAYAGAVPR